MKKITIVINTVNVTFDKDDIHYALRQILYNLANRFGNENPPSVIYDENGNRIGTVEIEW